MNTARGPGADPGILERGHTPPHANAKGVEENEHQSAK